MVKQKTTGTSRDEDIEDPGWSVQCKTQVLVERCLSSPYSAMCSEDGVIVLGAFLEPCLADCTCVQNKDDGFVEDEMQNEFEGLD